MYFLQGSTTEVAQDYRTFPWCFNWFMENVCPLFNPEWLKEQEKRKMKNNGTATWRKSHLIWYSNYNYSQLLGLIVSNKLLTSLYNGSFVNTCMPSMQLTPWPASHSDSTSISTSISSFFLIDFLRFLFTQPVKEDGRPPKSRSAVCRYTLALVFCFDGTKRFSVAFEQAQFTPQLSLRECNMIAYSLTQQEVSWYIPCVSLFRPCTL